MKRILVRGARQLVTLHGPPGPRRGAAMREIGVIRDGSLLIADGVIEEVGPTRRVENLSAARRAEEIDVSGKIVLPGFVDCHTHLVSGPPRLDDYEMRLKGASYQEIAAAGGGILSSVRALRGTTAARLAHQARRTIEQFVRHGVTTLEAKSGYGLDEPTEIKALRVARSLSRDTLDVVPTFLGAHAVPEEYAGRADDYIDWLVRHMLPEVKRRKLARYVDVYCERGAFTVEQSRRYLEAARALGFELKIHAEQFARTGAAALGVELGAASADHLEQAGEEEAALLARSNTVAVLLPASVVHLGLARFAPARALIGAGAAVALATDFNPGTSPTVNPALVQSLACAYMGMTPEETITAVTRNAACAIGMDGLVGALEPGKQADLIVLDAADYRAVPYYLGVNLVGLVMKRGEVIYRRARIEWPEAS